MTSERDTRRLRELEDQLATEDAELVQALRTFRHSHRLLYHRWLWTTTLVSILTLAGACLLFAATLPLAILLCAAAAGVAWGRQWYCPRQPNSPS